MRKKWTIRKRPLYKGAKKTGKFIWRVWAPGTLYSSSSFDTWELAWRIGRVFQWVDDRLELGCLPDDDWLEPQRVWCRDIRCMAGEHTMDAPHLYNFDRWPFPELGDTWYDRDSGKAYTFDGSVWNLVEPESPHIQRIVMLLAKADIVLEPWQLEMLRVYYKQKAGTDGY